MPLAAALRLSLFYLASFAVMGVYLPYFNLYLESIGFSGLQIAIVSLLLPLMATLAPTLGGVLADRTRRRRELVVASSLLALLTFSLVPAARAFGAMVAVITVYAALRSPALPLVEASAMEISAAGGPPYGRMRVWGSLAFIVTALGTGALVGARGECAAVHLIIALLALNAVSALLLPREKMPATVMTARPSLGRFVMQPRVLLFLLACLLSQASHAPYYVFYSIHLEKRGYPPQAIGLLWGVAIGCEIIAMLSMPRILRRLGTLPTMGASVLLASARWWICAASADPIAMVLAQAMHAATYAAFHVAAVTHTHHLFGDERRSSGQAVYSSATYGLGNMIGMFLSGVFYDRTAMANLFLGASATALLSGFLVVAAARKEAASGL